MQLQEQDTQARIKVLQTMVIQAKRVAVEEKRNLLQQI